MTLLGPAGSELSDLVGQSEGQMTHCKSVLSKTL